MIIHTLTHRTRDHNFWRTFELDHILYHITKRGEPMPTTGYSYPEYILHLKGYSNLDIKEVFKLGEDDTILMFSKNHFK